MALDAVRTAVRKLLEPGLAADNLHPRHVYARMQNELLDVEKKVLQRLIDATPIRPLDATKARLEQSAIEAVFNGTEWLTADQLGRKHDAQAKNPHSIVNRWRSARKLFGIERAGKAVFARYQFDETWQPRPAVAEILAAFTPYAPFRIA